MHHATGAVRSIFISDVHLGSRHSQASRLIHFLERYRPDYLYLVGDIIDGRCLKRRWFWSPAFSTVLERLHELSNQGTVVRYAIGNHDEFLRDSMTQQRMKSLGTLEIAEEFRHTTNVQQEFLVLHGDRFDKVEQSAAWVSHIASIFYESLLSANRIWSKWSFNSRSKFSLSSKIKRSVKSIVKYISDFEKEVAEYAKQMQCHGVICGHIHTPMKSKINGLTYCNTGDWVENCSAIVELRDGRLELVYFDDLQDPKSFIGSPFDDEASQN